MAFSVYSSSWCSQKGGLGLTRACSGGSSALWLGIQGHGTAALRERSCRRGGHGLMLALLVLGGRNMADPWRNLAMASMVVVSGRRRRSRAPVARQGRAWAVCVRACVRWSKGHPCANSTGSRRSERGGVMGTQRRFGGARADTVSGSKACQAGIKTLDKTWGWSWRPGTLQPVLANCGLLVMAAAGCRWPGSAAASQARATGGRRGDEVGEGCFKACCFPAR